MRDKKEFFSILNTIDGQDVEAYNQLVGDFDFTRYILKFNQIQTSGDDVCSLFVVRVPQQIAGFPKHLYSTPVRRTALEDYLVRRMSAGVEAQAQYNQQGVARRHLSFVNPNQKILPRSAVVVMEEMIEARIAVYLPSDNNKIEGDIAKQIFFDDLPEIVNHSLIYCNLDPRETDDFVNVMEDADTVRQVLHTRGWVSFIHEGALLARDPVTDLPNYHQMQGLTADDELLVEVDVPNAGTVRGLPIPRGVTLIVGDAYSGRYELIKGIADGIYNHIPGDGREMVITVPDAVYITAEKGRSVQRVDISSFVRENEACEDVVTYTAEEADACASQAANTIEMLEAGARVLLFDEQDSNPEFLSGDSRYVSMLTMDKARILSLSVNADNLANELGVSIIVSGAAAVGAMVPVADKIFRIDNHRISDITTDIKKHVSQGALAPSDNSDFVHLIDRGRWVIPSSVEPGVGHLDEYIEVVDAETLCFGRSIIDLKGATQIADVYQARTIGRILNYARQRYLDQPRPIRELLDLIDRDLSTEGIEVLDQEGSGDLARPRRYEIAMALNRLPSLRITEDF